MILCSSLFVLIHILYVSHLVVKMYYLNDGHVLQNKIFNTLPTYKYYKLYSLSTLFPVNVLNRLSNHQKCTTMFSSRLINSYNTLLLYCTSIWFWLPVVIKHHHSNLSSRLLTFLITYYNRKTLNSLLLTHAGQLFWSFTRQSVKTKREWNINKSTRSHFVSQVDGPATRKMLVNLHTHETEGN